jgi:hypothetical protein
MMPYYVNCPFIKQYPNTMYEPQSNAFPEPYFQQSMLQPGFYPAQIPYGVYYNYENIENINAGYENDPRQNPPPLLSNNPVTANIVLFKELTAYPNYGNPSRNADILYTGNRGTWTFESPAFLFVPGNQRAQIVIRAVLDDHSDVPVNRYSARITINGSIVHNGRLQLQHGTPAGGMFTNWRNFTFNITNLRRVNRITIENTSNTGENDWIGLDWMELRLLPR